MPLPPICPRCKTTSTCWTFIGADQTGGQVFLCNECAAELAKDAEPADMVPEAITRGAQCPGADASL